MCSGSTAAARIASTRLICSRCRTDLHAQSADARAQSVACRRQLSDSADGADHTTSGLGASLQAALAAFEHACCLYGQRVPDAAAILSIDAALQRVGPNPRPACWTALRLCPQMRPRSRIAAVCQTCAEEPHQSWDRHRRSCCPDISVYSRLLSLVLLQGHGEAVAQRFTLGAAEPSEAVAKHLVALADAGKLPQVGASSTSYKPMMTQCCCCVCLCGQLTHVTPATLPRCSAHTRR